MRITMITAVRNGAATVEQTIRSVLADGYPELEYVIVDGGSTDGTLDVVRRYSHGVSRLVSEADRGISDAFNKGIALATGEVVGIISADDALLPGALERVRSAVEAHPEADVVYGSAIYLEPDGRAVLSRPDPDLRGVALRSPLRHAAVFVRRAAYERFGAYDLRYALAMDYELILRMHRAGAVFVRVDEPLALIRTGGVSGTQYRRAIRETRDIALRHGTPAVLAHAYAAFNLGWTLLRRGLERTGLHWVIDRYRSRSRRFGEADAASFDDRAGA